MRFLSPKIEDNAEKMRSECEISIWLSRSKFIALYINIYEKL